MSGPVIVYSEDFIDRHLADALRNSGLQVIMGIGTVGEPFPREIIGITPTLVIGDDPCVSEIKKPLAKFGNPRPYLKRKKGRS